MTEPSPLDDNPLWWMEFANCKGRPVDWFFPHRGDHEGIDRAKAICAGCDVRAECLSYGHHYGFRVGIWGGRTERERRRERKAMRQRLGLSYNYPLEEADRAHGRPRNRTG